MMLTSLNVVSPSTSMNVVRMDTAAISSGSNARNDANTKRRTRSAPAAASKVSSRTLELSWSPPADSRPYDVRPLSKPRDSAAFSSAGSSSTSTYGPSALGTGAWIRANVVRPSPETKLGSPVLAKSTTRSFTSGTAATAVVKIFATAALFSCTVWPSGTVTTAT